MVEEIFSAFGQSNVIEVAVKVSKAQASKSPNKQMANYRRWSSLFENMGERWFDYKAIPWQGAAIPRGMQNKRRVDMFGSANPNRSGNFNDICGTGAAVFFSPQAHRDSIWINDLEWLRWCHQNQKPATINDIWWSCLVPEEGAILREQGTTTWFWCLGHSFNTGRLCFEAVEINDGTNVLFQLGNLSPKSLKWIFVVDPEHWECCPVKYNTPLAIESSSATSARKPTTLIAKPEGKPASLLVWSAKKSFGKLPKTVLMRVAKKLGCPIDDGTSLYQVCCELIRFIIPKTTDAERCWNTSPAQGF